MAVTVTVSSVVFEPGQSRCFVKFSDGDVYGFRSKADLQSVTSGIDPRDLVKRLALAIWQARGIVDGTELAGRTITMDLTVNNFGVIS